MRQTHPEKAGGGSSTQHHRIIRQHLDIRPRLQVGDPHRPDTITREFVARVKTAGLPHTDVKGLRHAHATALLKEGVHPKVVQERLGDSSIAVTMDIYSSVLPGMQREAVERVGRPDGSIVATQLGHSPQLGCFP